MPRQLYEREPPLLTEIVDPGDDLALGQFVIATSNANKIGEWERLIPPDSGIEVIPVVLDIEEVQSKDPLKVAEEKAILARRMNNENPVPVADNSLDIPIINNWPGTYVKDYTGTPAERQDLLTMAWLKHDQQKALGQIEADPTIPDGPRVIAREVIAIHTGGKDGFQYRMGVTEGVLPKSLRGANGFGWDDMVIPLAQKDQPGWDGVWRTFAEMSMAPMTDDSVPDYLKKDTYSMRRKAVLGVVERPFKNGSYTVQMPEPWQEELDRVRTEELLGTEKEKRERIKRFAFALEPLEAENAPNNSLTAPNYPAGVIVTDRGQYISFTTRPDSPSHPLIFFPYDGKDVKTRPNGIPLIRQMGPERRHLALAERADWMRRILDERTQQAVDAIMSGERNPGPRVVRKHATIDTLLGIERDKYGNRLEITRSAAWEELGYRKDSSSQEVSRDECAYYGLFRMIGKQPRRMFQVGSTWTNKRDIIVTAAVGDQMVFIPRTFEMESIERRIALAKEAKDTIRRMDLEPDHERRALNNIGFAIGTNNPRRELEDARRAKDEAGVTLFREYTINADPRVIEVPRLLREEFGDDIEIAVGQVATKEQLERLTEKDIRLDMAFLSHAAGRQCTSGENGMAITTIEEVTEVLEDHRFANLPVLVEGGVGQSLGALIVLGVDGIIYNQQFFRGTIEEGDLFFVTHDGRHVRPYHGNASVEAMKVRYAITGDTSMIRPSGRARRPEGKRGWTVREDKANSMAYWMDIFWGYGGRVLADLGCKDMYDLHKYQDANRNREVLRIVTPKAKEKAGAYRNRV